MKLIRQVTLDSARRLKDKSVNMRFVTSLEQDSDEFMEIDKALGKHGILYFKDDGDLTKEEVNALDSVSIEVTGKSKSQSLRAAIMVLHRETGSMDSKEEFYARWMDKFKQHILDKIPD